MSHGCWVGTRVSLPCTAPSSQIFSERSLRAVEKLGGKRGQDGQEEMQGGGCSLKGDNTHRLRTAGQWGCLSTLTSLSLPAGFDGAHRGMRSPTRGEGLGHSWPWPCHTSHKKREGTCCERSLSACDRQQQVHGQTRGDGSRGRREKKHQKNFQSKPL